MALIDPFQSLEKRPSPQHPTKHPGLCLLGLFSVLVGSAVAVHLLFSMIT